MESKELEIKIGTRVIAKMRTGVCEIGEKGVCVGIYQASWNRNNIGFYFLFESMGFDGFSLDDIEQMLHIKDEIPLEYKFISVPRVMEAFHNGFFKKCFEEA